MITPLLGARRLAQATLPGAALVALAVLQSGAAEAANTATVNLDNFIQNGVITNSPTSTDVIPPSSIAWALRRTILRHGK